MTEPAGMASPARIVLATRNPGKLAELRRILAAAGVSAAVTDLDDVPGMPEVAETGRTFTDNALLKARAVAAFTGLPAVADDSGLCVDALNGMPGVLSARWSGSHGDDEPRNHEPGLDRNQHRRGDLVRLDPLLERERRVGPRRAAGRWTRVEPQAGGRVRAAVRITRVHLDLLAEHAPNRAARHVRAQAADVRDQRMHIAVDQGVPLLGVHRPRRRRLPSIPRAGLVGLGQPDHAVGDQLTDLAVVITGAREDLSAVLAQQRRRQVISPGVCDSSIGGRRTRGISPSVGCSTVVTRSRWMI